MSRDLTFSRHALFMQEPIEDHLEREEIIEKVITASGQPH